MHGGKSLTGIASSTYKTGRYSKVLPARLTERYEESENDAKLLELRAEVSLIDSRIVDLLHRVDKGESGHIWKELKAAHKEMTKATRIGDTVTAAVAMDEIGHLINAGAQDYAAWGEVLSVVEQRRKLVESERKRLTEAQQTLTIEQAMLMIGALTGIIRTHVTDRSILAAISADVGKLITVESS